MKTLILALALTLLTATTAEAPEVPEWEQHIKHRVPAAAEERDSVATSMVFRATAYSWECGTGDNLTASMTPVRPGVVAVDPKVIPLGSQVEIVGLGVFSAEDVGGLIKGDRIDIFMPSRGEALRWGVRAVEVRVIP